MLRHAALLLTLLAPPAFAADADCTADVDLAPALKLDIRYRCQNGAEGRYQADLTRGDSSNELIVRGQGANAGALVTIGTWLQTPRGYDRAPTIDIRVNTAPGLVFAAGLPKVGDAWRLAGTPTGLAGYSALGKVSLYDLNVPAPGSLRAGAKKEDGVLRLAILNGFTNQQQAEADLVDWVNRTAEAEANWWQGFTANQALVGLVPTGARGPAGYGRTVSGGGPTVMVEVGRDVDRRRLFSDWVLVHELVHTGMPYIRGRATWFMEGAATYVEPVIRARAGWRSEAEAWKEWIDNMPRGAPVFARGLATSSGREDYWSGALFMLMADIDIRRLSNGRKGLEDCLGGALWAGFDGPRRVALQDYVAACDRATGTTAVSALLERHFNAGNAVDLADWWKQLGVALIDGRIVLDDSAPLAKWRKMIVMGPAGRPARPVKLPWQT